MNRDLCVKVCDGSQALWCENCGCKCGPYMGCGGKPMKRAPENKPLRKAAEILAGDTGFCPFSLHGWPGCPGKRTGYFMVCPTADKKIQKVDCWYRYCIEEGST